MARELPQRVHDAVRWETGLVVALVAVISFGVLVSSQFLTASNVFYLNLSIGEVAIMTLPMTLIIVTGEIDLSVASILGLSSALLGDLVSHGWSVPAAMAAVLVAGTAAGVFNGFLITRVGLPSLAVTIGTLTLYRGIAVVILGPSTISAFPARYTDIGVTPFPHTGGYLSYSVVIFIVLAIIFGVVLHATPFGRSLFVMGSNVEAARFAGIRVKRTKLILFAVSGLVCALAGILYTFRLSTAVQDNGLGLELNVSRSCSWAASRSSAGAGRSSAWCSPSGCSRVCRTPSSSRTSTSRRRAWYGRPPARERPDPQHVVVRPARTHLLQAATPTRRPRVAREGARGVSGADHVALDLGAESGRAMLGRFDGERVELAEVRRFPTQSIQLPDGLYWNALGLYAELAAALAQVSASGARPRSIGVDSWGVDFGLLDRHGALLGNPLCYRDGRGSQALHETLAQGHGDEIYAATGIQFLPFNTLYQLLALRRKADSSKRRRSC